MGDSTAATIVANKVAPAPSDRYLARTGFKSQEAGEKAGPDRPQSLWESAAGEGGHDMTPSTRIERAFHNAVSPSEAAGNARADREASPSPVPAPDHRPDARVGAASYPRATAAPSVIRAGLGATHLLFPGLASRVVVREPLDEQVRWVVRVPGARQVVQAVLTGGHPSDAVLALGTGVDALLATSMVILAVFDRRRRRVALTDALVACGFASAGFVTVLTRRQGANRA